MAGRGEGMHAGETATEVDGTHPTTMHSVNSDKINLCDYDRSRNANTFELKSILDRKTPLLYKQWNKTRI